MKTLTKPLYLTFIIAFLTVATHSQKVTVKGIVSDETGPLPGASVAIKGTNKGTTTNFDGEYTIEANIGDTLVYSFVGLVSVEKIIKSPQTTDVKFKVDIILDLEMHGTYCYIESQYVNANFYGGLKYSNYGVLLDFNLPYLFRVNSDLKIGYQSDFKDNNKILLEAGVNYIFRIGKQFNASLKYNEINITYKNFNYKDYKVLINTSIKTIFDRYTKLYLGVGKSEYNLNKNIGYEIGFQQYLSNRIRINSNITYWNDFWQLQNGVQFEYKRFNIFIEYVKIKNFEDFNVGFGYVVYL